MKRNHVIPSLTLAAAFVASACAASAQQSFYERLRANNSASKEYQPSWIGPLVETDSRLSQNVKAAFSKEYSAARTETVSYGNGKGVSLISGNRFEFDYLPPSYIQHNSKAVDGLGDTSTQVKGRIASGNADHGNFDLTAVLSHSFSTGTYKNGALTDVWSPTLAGGYAFLRRFDVQSSLGGSMPTGKIATQGRSIASNALMQMHATKKVWFEVENNATFYFAGSHDGKMQNFVTPAAFYVVRRKEWAPAHAYMVFDAGMQIATSGFHTYNHNLITESRLYF